MNTWQAGCRLQAAGRRLRRRLQAGRQATAGWQAGGWGSGGGGRRRRRRRRRAGCGRAAARLIAAVPLQGTPAHQLLAAQHAQEAVGLRVVHQLRPAQVPSQERARQGVPQQLQQPRPHRVLQLARAPQVHLHGCPRPPPARSTPPTRSHECGRGRSGPLRARCSQAGSRPTPKHRPPREFSIGAHALRAYGTREIRRTPRRPCPRRCRHLRRRRRPHPQPTPTRLPPSSPHPQQCALSVPQLSPVCRVTHAAVLCRRRQGAGGRRRAAGALRPERRRSAERRCPPRRLRGGQGQERRQAELGGGWAAAGRRLGGGG